jgi:hypothetical protein
VATSLRRNGVLAVEAVAVPVFLRLCAGDDEAQRIGGSGTEQAVELHELRSPQSIHTGDDDQAVDLRADRHRVADSEQRRRVDENEVSPLAELSEHVLERGRRYELASIRRNRSRW